MDADREKERVRKASREFSGGMKKISGMDVSELNRDQDLLEHGMKEGVISFTLDEGRQSGTLKILGNEFKIKDRDQASMYQGIQDKAKNQKP